MAAREMAFSFSLGATLASSFKGAVGSARSQIVGLSRDVRGMEKSSTGRLGASFDASKNKVRSLGGELKGARAQLESLKARAAASGASSGAFARQIFMAEGRVKTLSGSLRQAASAHRTHAAAIKSETGSVTRLSRDYATLSSNMDKMRAKQQRLSANTAARDANKARRGDLRGGMIDTLALGASVALPAKFAIDFEDSMAKVGALARASKEDLARLTAQARQLGRDTVFSASQAAEGMSYLAMAGFNTKNTMAAMPGLLQLAAAGGSELGRTADIASNILSAFSIKAEEMGRVSDVLAYTFTSSNTTLETLGDTMKYVGPVSAAVNMSLEDTAATVGLLGNVGIQGSQAGTALRAALLRLAAPAKMGAEALGELTGVEGPELEDMLSEIKGGQQALREMGVQTKDSAGNLRPMVDIMEELNAKMAGMGSGERMEKIKKIFGSEASAAIVALMEQAGKTVDEEGNKIVDSYGKQSTALRKYMADIAASSGTGERIARQMNDTTGGSLRVMRSALEDVAIVTGNLFSPAIREAAGYIGIGANKVSALMERFPRLSSAVGMAAGSVIALSVASKGLAYSYTFLKDGLLLAQGALLRMTGAQIGGAAATHGLTLAQRVWATGTLIAANATRAVTMAMRVMNFVMLKSPIGLILGGVALAAGYIIQNWSSIGPWFAGMWENITAYAARAWAFLKEYFWDKNPLTLGARLVIEKWESISNSLDPVFTWLGEKFSWVTDSFKGLGKAYDFFFGDEDKAATLKAGAEESAALAVKASPTLAAAAPAKDDPFAGMSKAPDFQSQPTVNAPAPPVNFDTSALPGGAATYSGGEIKSETNISLSMNFDVKGLDEGEFRKKIEGYRSDFEKIVKRVVGDMEHNKTRLAYAP
ncbi:phage tail tape measure protein [Desulfovibrio sp. OttesenSCG-928-G11]|nr:phage tail tape measure protein [Desulfovibrio sp. OttesenSCG-928-G11]